MNQPYINFFPRDWLAEYRLRMLSPADRGIWIDLLCIMAMAEPYGYLTNTGKALTDEEVSHILSIDIQVYKDILKRLLDAGVCSINKDGIIFSRRLVRDYEKKIQASEFGKKGGGNPVFKKKLPIKIPIKVSIKDDYQGKEKEFEKYSIIIQKFYEIQKKQYPNYIKFDITEKVISEGIKEIEKIIRLDKQEPDKIIAMLEWIPQDQFWGRNVLSLKSLRTLSRNGNKKFINIMLSMEKLPEKQIRTKFLQYEIDQFTEKGFLDKDYKDVKWDDIEKMYIIINQQKYEILKSRNFNVR